MGAYSISDMIPMIYTQFAIIVVPGVITGAYTWWTGWREDENQVYGTEIIDVDFGTPASSKAA